MCANEFNYASLIVGWCYDTLSLVTYPGLHMQGKCENVSLIQQLCCKAHHKGQCALFLFVEVIVYILIFIFMSC